jgi:predicted acyl esterase
VEKEKPVRYFVMGDDQWHESDAWPLASTSTSFYLASPKSGEKHGGLWADAPREKKAFGSFLSDPEKPVVNSYSSSGAHDYRSWRSETTF